MNRPLAITGLMFLGLACPLVGATRLDIEIKSGNIRLAGTLVLPDGEGPFPGVVMMGGSGPSTRPVQQPMADELVSRGWAVLTYDKRGCGSSTGDWTSASLLDLSDDALGALRALTSRSEVNRNRVGLWGVSQSGWIGPLVAGRTDAVRFLMVVTGGGATPRQVETYGYEKRLADLTLSSDQVALAHATINTYFHYLATGEGNEALTTILAAPENRLWVEALGLARVVPSEHSRRAWEWVATYDPIPDISRLKIPALVLLGGKDEYTPLNETFVGWNTGLLAAGDPRSRVLVVPLAGHVMTVGGHHRPPTSARYAPGVYDAVVDWERATLGGR